ncbi:MAG: phosphorybosylanthranilate isomerase, partial [Planctomycetes bacterium]|nr:phosphorybosylanthranilate isomerase [Planctomycetota bacterium]
MNFFSAGSPRPILIAALHLAPLPGAPRHRGSLEEVFSQAQDEAAQYAAAGVDAILVENHGDAPFPKDHSDPWVAASVAVLVDRLRRSHGL